MAEDRGPADAGRPWLSGTAPAGTRSGVLALMRTDTDARTQLLSAALTALIPLAAALHNPREKPGAWWGGTRIRARSALSPQL
ncbi:hypothetical protein [Streptomyces sp. NPDC001435]|uniref:hypothetical protein n=1 Tax=unclassified Streptomyces TaxID=2593676 RepID=UPI0036AD67E3